MELNVIRRLTLLERRALSKSRMLPSEHIMVFYLIGVAVVVILIAGFFGLHV
jgi:hypothetical protein